jgi:succinoglycan biosynthesis protein ExoM
MTSDAPIRHSILIASVGRDTLARTLTSIRAAALRNGANYEIIVADDSIDGRVRPILEQLEGGRDAIKLIHVGAGNISIARNACLDAATGEFVLFIDDDEWVEPDWIDLHSAVMERTAADATFGAVTAFYTADTPEWLSRADLFSRHNVSDGQLLTLGSTANAMVRRATVQCLGLRFREEFGRTGGEDSDFFGRLRRNGGKLVGSAARVSELVPADRCSMRYLRLRAIRAGQTYAKNALIGASNTRKMLFGIDAAAKACLLGIRTLATAPLDRGRALHPLLAAFRNLGKLREIFNLPLIVYYAEQDAVTTDPVDAVSDADPRPHLPG